MYKLLELRRLNFSLSIKVIIIYFKRLFGAKINENDIGLLSYLFTLETCNLSHVSVEGNCFAAIMPSGIKLFMRKHPSSDTQVLHQIWVDKEYEIIVDLIKKKFHQPDICIVDAGANVGYSSLYLYYYLKDHFNVKLIVIEPSRENLEILDKNFTANNLTDYHIEEAGLFNKTCYLNILRDFRDGRDWSLRIEEAEQHTNLKSVELLSLMKKYSWGGVDFCKIDIEGAEKYIFQNRIYANSFLENIKLISIEIHDEMVNRQDIQESLNANKFEYFKHGELTIGYSIKN